MKRIASVAVLIGIALSAFPPAAGGDIYWFEDELGVVHMSNVPVDARFRFKEMEARQNETKIFSGKSERGYDKLIDKVARSEGLDSDLLRAVVETESNYDPKAVSNKGAVGLMQLMPETARGMGVAEPLHPEENLEAGARHLRRLIDKYEGTYSYSYVFDGQAGALDHALATTSLTPQATYLGFRAVLAPGQ